MDIERGVSPTYTQPLIAVPFTGRSSVGQTGGKTVISLMIDPPDTFSEPVALVSVCHN